MDIIRGATRLTTLTANATTAAAGAVGGAAINGVIGGVQGTAKGVRDGLATGSRSTPAALLTVGAVGAAGLVDWPVLLTVGGAALLIRQFGPRDAEQPAATPTAAPKPAASRQRSGSSNSTSKRTAGAPRQRSTRA